MSGHTVREVVFDLFRSFGMMTIFGNQEMTCWPVSARVGNVKNNDPSLIEAIAA
jgi:hypothetical protein